MMQKFKLFCFIIPIALILIVSFSYKDTFAAQQVIFSQLPNHMYSWWSDSDQGNPGILLQIYAENFILSSTSTIFQIKLWGVYWPTNTPVGPDNFTVGFHTDVSGSPGPLIGSVQNNVPVSRVNTGIDNDDGYREYEYTLTLTSPVILSAGTYWLEIYNNTSSNYDANFGWSWGNVDPTSGISGSAISYTSAPGSSWESHANVDFSFQLLGAPVSVSIPAMTELGMIIVALLAGSGAIYFMRRTKKTEN